MDSPDEEVMGPNMNFSEVSTTMKCIISLTIQYMVVYTALGICRSYLDFTKTAYADSQVQKALKSASETMFYAPGLLDVRRLPHARASAYEGYWQPAGLGAHEYAGGDVFDLGQHLDGDVDSACDGKRGEDRPGDGGDGKRRFEPFRELCFGDCLQRHPLCGLFGSLRRLRGCVRRRVPLQAAAGRLGWADPAGVSGSWVHDDLVGHVLHGLFLGRRQPHVLAVRRRTAVHEQLRASDASRGGHARHGADALRLVPRSSHARASDGSGHREPAEVGAELLLRVHVRLDLPDRLGSHRSALPLRQGGEEREDLRGLQVRAQGEGQLRCEVLDCIPLLDYAVPLRVHHGCGVLGLHHPASGRQGVDPSFVADYAVRVEPRVPVFRHLPAPLDLLHGRGLRRLGYVDPRGGQGRD